MADFKNFYQDLMVFISLNFRMTYRVDWNELSKQHEKVAVLVCGECGCTVKEWEYPMTDETEMMREIGIHLDTVDHPEVPCWLGSKADLEGRGDGPQQ